MTDRQAQLDQSIQRIVEAIDRDSSVSLSVQLKGAIEFGIALGDLPAGARMPSVRQMAGMLGMSPVTVSGVYSTLQGAGHIEARVGSGTFVREAVAGRPVADLRDLDRRIAELVDLGRKLGIGPAELATRISHSGNRPPQALRLLMLGNFHATTASYADALQPFLAPQDQIFITTLQDGHGPDACPDPDLVIAPRTLLPQAAGMFPRAECFGLTLIPDQATRVSLATVSPDARVVAYSYFPGFVTSMKAGVIRFAPHVTRLTMVVHGDPEAEAQLAAADVIVYASGTERLFTDLPPGQSSFEYHHTPDSNAVRSELVPMLEALRIRPPGRKEPAP
ncbi:GntR family transcriptional regulator [Gemmobacter sp.]|uniref:GntR family transcriptional regulator n=1 Tax=Gemmobacter sp. TaxID=1898957 RepID=UPI002B002BCB|nr:GntR family transcriptional regulator [Gemmobacter sp.]